MGDGWKVRRIRELKKKAETDEPAKPACTAQLKARLLSIRLANHVSGGDILKKNKINKELDKDTGGNKYEQDLLDTITGIVDKEDGGNNARKVSDAFKKRKRNKKTGEVSFTIR